MYYELMTVLNLLDVDGQKVKWRHCTAETLQDVYNCVASSSRNHHNIPQLVNDDQHPVVFYNCKEF
ncbi:hypothetical protein KUTeg_008799 [Tegillarca granosa]|uniref:Uncharacterized protein n=1 Tax=Tegillarca granosa TaxID=220873 RepID=A0ABQ9FA40_TEGGR|nr:hypothetical protein KUTeg_008799 [Tegillarca granosa]